MTLKERAGLWHASAKLAGTRPEWWQRVIIRVLLGNRYDKKLLTTPRRISRDTNAT
jgi:hypothetical protein